MATNNRPKRDDEGRFAHRNRLVEGVRDRPYTAATAAALATVAAGAAAFFLTRDRGDKPLLKWGSASNSEAKSDAAAFKGDGAKPIAAKIDVAGSSPTATALDDKADAQTKVGSIAY